MKRDSPTARRPIWSRLRIGLDPLGLIEVTLRPIDETETDNLIADIPRLSLNSDSTAKQVARELLRLIVRSDSLKTGDRLPSERELAGAFGVGRAAIREALKSLDILGLVDIRPGSGTFLTSPDTELIPRMLELGLLLGEDSIADVVETRALLEVASARLAAVRRSVDDLSDLERILTSMESGVDDTEEFAEFDIAFHLALAKSTGNRTLSAMLSSVQSLLRVWITRVASAQEGDFVQMHRAVFDAVRDGDPDRAEAAMRTHMQDARERLSATLPHSALAE